MKILDKIVVSKNQPKSKNVLWYDSESGEQKAFTSKGWEAISGKSGVVKQTISENFTFTASPGIFYNIENTPDTEVNISFDDNYKATGKNDTEIAIACTAVDPTYDENAFMLTEMSLYGNGWVCTPAASGEFSYLYTVQPDIKWVEATSMMFTDKKLVKGEKVKVHTQKNEIQEEEEFEIIINDIYYYNNPHVKILVGQDIHVTGFIVEEKESDDPDFGYKYTVWNPFLLEMVNDVKIDVYTKKPYYNDTVAYVNIQGEIRPLNYEYVAPKEQKPVIQEGKQVGEYIFNIKSPANVVFNSDIKWNNNNAPDLTLIGNYTISIVDGVGCYTYTN